MHDANMIDETEHNLNTGHPGDIEHLTGVNFLPVELSRNEAQLREMIRLLVEQFYGLDDGNVRRDLCRLALQWQVDPEYYRQLLLEADLLDPRASEIKTLLLAPEVCRRFVDGTLTFRAALELSRDAASDPIKRASGAFFRTFLTEGKLWETGQTEQGWTIERGPHEVLRLIGNCGTLEVCSVTPSSEGANS
jgi:hypothetical protein